MADTKYLQKRGNGWYIRVPKPPVLWGTSGEFVCSLRTSDFRVARHLRDKYLVPLLAETTAAEMVSAIARSSAAANESIARLLSELRVGVSGQDSDLTLKDAAERFLSYLKSSGSYAPSTLGRYRASIEAACRLLGEDSDPNTISKADAAKLRDTLARRSIGRPQRSRSSEAGDGGGRRLSATSVSYCLMCLRRMFRWLKDEGHILRSDNPFDSIRVARISANHKRAPSAAEADALMDLPRPGAIAEDVWRMMPILARYTGCRAGEVAQLRREDIVVERGVRCLRITARGIGKRLKTGSSERLVPVADRLAPHLDKLLKKKTRGRLLDAGDWKGADGTEKYGHQFLKYWNERAKKVAPDLCFHCWRVYANDAMASAGVDILDRERLLGHRSERTQAAYTPQNLRRLKAAVDAIP